MDHVYPVFISYAREASAASAQALHAALPGQCYLDTSDIEAGERFTEHVVDALLKSRVVVVFATEMYFQRRYCLWELRAALEPYEARLREGKSLDGELDHLIVVIPDGDKPTELDRLPPSTQSTSWLPAEKTELIAALIENRLRQGGRMLQERYEAVGPTAVRARLLALTALPPAASFGLLTPVYPANLTTSSLREDFVGRANELHRIDFWLRTLRGERVAAPPIVTIEGLGGLGKTRLALEYVHRFAPRYFSGGVIWINAGEDLDSQFHGALRALDPHTPDLPTMLQQKRDVREELARAVRTRAARDDVLWVVDEVPEPPSSEGSPALGKYCPALGQVSVLMTSRRRLSLEPGRRNICLRELEPEAAVQLLTRGLSFTSQLQQEGWRAIAEWVGGLPLALALLNQVLLSGYSPRALLEVSRKERTTAMLDRAMDALRGEVEAGALRGVTDAFALSYELLSPSSQTAARLLACLAPAPIPMALVEELGAFPIEVRCQLTRRSFVTTNAASDASSEIFGSMHRILADYIRTRESNADQTWSRVSGALERVLDQASHGADRWRLLVNCAPHALQVLQEKDCMTRRTARVTVSLQVAVSRSLSELGQKQKALEVIEGVVNVYRRLARRMPGAFGPKLAESLDHLSSCLRAVGRQEEALAITEAMNMYRQMLLGDSSITIRREWNELRRRMARSFTGLTSLIHRLEAPLRRWLAEDRCTESTELSPPPPALLVLPETERIRTETTAPGPPPMKGAGIPQAPEPTSDVRLARNDTQVTTPDGQEGPGSSDGAEELSERPTVIARDEPETTAPVPPPRKRSLLPPPPGLDERPTISGTWPSGLQPSARRWARWMLWTGIACATLVLASMASVTLGDDLWYIVLRESRRPGNEAPATQAPSLPSAPSPAPTPSSRSSGTPVDAPVQGRSTVPFPP